MSNTKTDVTYSLPDGWRVLRLGDVATIRKERVNPCSDDTRKYVGLEHIVSNEFRLSGTGTVGETASLGTRFNAGDTLYGKLRPNLRKAIRPRFAGVCTTELLVLYPIDSDLDAGFLYRTIINDSFHTYALGSITGTRMPRTSWNHLSSFKFPIPPIYQQRKIAEVLDSIDGAIERTEGVIGATEQVRDALLYELLSRGMPGWHREWRDVPGVGTLPASWDVVRLGDVADITKGTSITKSQTIPGEIPVIGGGFVPSYYHNQANRTGETVTVSASGAHAGFVSYHNGPIFASDCSTIKPKNDHISTKFLFRLLKSKQAYIYDRQSGTGQPHIYPKDLQGIRVPLPSSQEQHAICGVLNSVDDSLDGLRSERDSMQVLKRSVADGLLTGRVRVPVVRD